MNDQQNILDIIVSDDIEEILGLYLYKTKKAGIHQSVERISGDIIKIQKDDLENIDQLFNQIQLDLVKTTGLRISSIRIFKQQAIYLIDNHCKAIPHKSMNESVIGLLNLIQKVCKDDLFYIYPTPNFYKFIKYSLNILNGVNISTIYQMLYNAVPKLNSTIFLNSIEQPLLLTLQKTKADPKNSELFLKLLTLEELDVKMEDYNKIDFLTILRKKTKSEKVYELYQNDVIALLLDLFESESPPSFNRFKIIFQKLLWGIRNFENKWYRIPQPKVYNSLLRFLIRIFRFNLNLKKLSHWAIPEFIFNFIETNFGLNSKIVIILTEINKRNFNKVEYIKNAFKSALLIEYEDRRIKNISSINKNELFSEHQINTLEVIRVNISKKYGYISAVINIDSFVFNEIIKNFGSNVFNFSLFSNFKSLNLFKKDYYFNVFPEIAEFKFMKEVGISKFLKTILPILIDKYEF